MFYAEESATAKEWARLYTVLDIPPTVEEAERLKTEYMAAATSAELDGRSGEALLYRTEYRTLSKLLACARAAAAYNAQEDGRVNVFNLVDTFGIPVPEGLKTAEQYNVGEWIPFEKSETGEDGHLYIEGYAARFNEMDAHGEILDPGAFDDTLEEYMKNPVVLADHQRKTTHAVGRVVDARVDPAGLWVRVRISKARDQFTTMIREKILSGELSGFSIGGRMIYNGTRIVKVKLSEISITPTPAMKNALFRVARNRGEETA